MPNVQTTPKKPPKIWSQFFWANKKNSPEIWPEMDRKFITSSCYQLPLFISLILLKEGLPLKRVCLLKGKHKTQLLSYVKIWLSLNGNGRSFQNENESSGTLKVRPSCSSNDTSHIIWVISYEFMLWLIRPLCPSEHWSDKTIFEMII